MNRVNNFPHELREIVEMDIYLGRLQRAFKMKDRQWSGRDMNTAAYMARALRSRVIEMRSVYQRDASDLARDIPIVYSATGVPGVGVMSFLAVAIYIDIERATTPASLWRYCGYGVDGNRADTIVTLFRPGKIGYNDRVRRSLGQLRWNLLMQSRYRPYYAEYRAMQRSKGYPAIVATRRAQRYAVKMWLKHLWLVWRRQEGLPLGVGHEEDETGLAAPFGWR